MVKRFISFFHKEFSGLHQAAFLLGLSAFMSQVLALLRDRSLAALFGTSTTLDIYYAAFKIPDTLFASIASFVSVTVLIPFLIERYAPERREEARRFMSATFSLFCAVMVVAIGVLFFLIPLLAPLVAPGFDAVATAKFITFSRILLLSPLFLGLSNLLGSVTQAFRKFFVYALTPVVYNVGILIGILVFYPLVGNNGLVYGVILGAVLQLVIQLPTVYKAGLLPRFTFNLEWPVLKRVILISLPRTIALAMDKVSLLVLVSLASIMAVGSISIFNFALNLESVPLAIIGVSYSVAAFPALAKIFKEGERHEFIEQLSSAVRHILFWSMPATVLFIVLRAQIVRVILGSGRFNWSDTRLVAAALALFTIAVAAQGLMLLFVRAYYAGGNTVKPLMINISCSILTVALALIFMKYFDEVPKFRHFLEVLLRVDAVGRDKVLVLPLAYSLGDIINAGIYWWYFRTDFGKLPRSTYTTLIQVTTASLAAGVAAYGMLLVLANHLNLNTFVGILSQGLSAGLVGIAVYTWLVWLLGSAELQEISKVFSGRLWGTRKIVVKDDEN